MARVVYTEAQKQWLKEHHNDASWPVLAERFNAKFGTRTKTSNIQYLAYSMGLSKAYYYIPGCFVYKPEHEQWLRENRNGKTLKELTDQFNSKYGCSQTSTQLSSKLSYMGVNRTDPEYWKKPIGSERVVGKHTFIKVMDSDNDNKNWILKSKYIYAQFYGEPVKTGETVLFLDGDQNNYSKENLVKVSNKVVRILSKYRWLFFGQKELQECAIKWCECAEYIQEHFNPDFNMREWARRERIHELY